MGGAGGRGDVNPASIKKSAARAEMQRRHAAHMAERRAQFSIEAACAGHPKQQAFARDQSKYIIAMCSRRAGKSSAIVRMMAEQAMRKPSVILYIALTRGQAKKLMWTDLGGMWLTFLADWGIEAKHDRAELITTFPNGSTVQFSGTDDLKHVETKLGSKLDLAIVDESQSQMTAVMDRLCVGILPPALSDEGGRLVLAGTIPESPAGFFWKQWDKKTWSPHSWSRFENPFMKDQRLRLDEFLAMSGLPESDPLVQRDWHGVITFDVTALAFRYDRDRNGFLCGSVTKDPLGKWTTFIAPPEIIKKCKFFCVGGDQGGSDRCSVEVNGWSDEHQEVYQVYEWSTTENHGGAWSGFGPRLDEIKALFGDLRHFFDFGGSKLTMDNFRTDHGVYVLQAPKKSDRKGQVDRMNGLYQQGRKHVMKESALETDCLTTKWDKDAREKGKWEWSSDNHPDAADADRYSCQGYVDGYVPPEAPKTQSQLADEDVKRVLEEGENEAPWFQKDLDNLLPDGGSTLW